MLLKKGIPVTCEEQSTLYYYCIGLFLAPAVQSLCENNQASAGSMCAIVELG